MEFREILQLFEAVKEFEFDIEINGVKYTVIRDWHLTKKRQGDPKPKDFNMSKSKYSKLFQEAIKSNMDLTKPFSVSWTSNNGKNNIISAQLKGFNFEVFGAIMSSSIDAEKLYKVALQRLHLNSL